MAVLKNVPIVPHECPSCHSVTSAKAGSKPHWCPQCNNRVVLTELNAEQVAALSVQGPGLDTHR